jgi:hypothetical protein
MSWSLYTSPSLRICHNTSAMLHQLFSEDLEKKKYVTATRHIFIPFSSRFISYIIKTSLASCFLDGTCAGIKQGSRYCTFVSRNLMYLKKLEKSGEVTFPETCSSFHVTFFPCPDSRLVLLCYNKREQVHFNLNNRLGLVGWNSCWCLGYRIITWFT